MFSQYFLMQFLKTQCRCNGTNVRLPLSSHNGRWSVTRSDTPTVNNGWLVGYSNSELCNYMCVRWQTKTPGGWLFKWSREGHPCRRRVVCATANEPQTPQRGVCVVTHKRQLENSQSLQPLPVDRYILQCMLGRHVMEVWHDSLSFWLAHRTPSEGCKEWRNDGGERDVSCCVWL